MKTSKPKSILAFLFARPLAFALGLCALFAFGGLVVYATIGCDLLGTCYKLFSQGNVDSQLLNEPVFTNDQVESHGKFDITNNDPNNAYLIPRNTVDEWERFVCAAGDGGEVGVDCDAEFAADFDNDDGRASPIAVDIVASGCRMDSDCTGGKVCVGYVPATSGTCTGTENSNQGSSFCSQHSNNSRDACRSQSATVTHGGLRWELGCRVENIPPSNVNFNCVTDTGWGYNVQCADYSALLYGNLANSCGAGNNCNFTAGTTETLGTCEVRAWHTGTWGACVNGTKTRTVECKDVPAFQSGGTVHPDSECPGTKPDTSSTQPNLCYSTLQGSFPCYLPTPRCDVGLFKV